MEVHGISSVFVVDRKGALIGYVRAEDAAEAAEKGQRELDGIIQNDVPTAFDDTPLSELLDVLAYTKVPVAVIDEEKILKGVLVRGSVIAGLAGERRDWDE
jgi:glycine betaine/proline transport system ATP-binding protein